jgi:2-methylcitrate dehydratase PrpD
MPVADTLSAFALETEGASVPEQVRSRAVLHLLDTVGCGLAAVGLGEGGHATAVALAQEGRPEASVSGSRTLVPAASAALANGTRCHALDFDDTHEAGICHASTVVAPAALAAGEATGASGADVLTAYVLGAEVALRIAVQAADELYERGFHPTPVCGAFGATAASARLLGLDRDTTVNALGIVGSFAAGLFEYLADGSDTKPLHAGWAAQAGVQAARLAQAGASGPSTVIEGRFGVLASHGADPARAEAITERLGERWEFPELAIKPFPACHFLHASTWAAGELAEAHRLAAEDIEEAFVRVPPEGARLVLEPLEAKLAPRTPYDAKFSLPYTLAHRIVHGRLDLRSFAPDAIREPDVLELARRVKPEALDGGGAPSRFAGGARIVTHDGRTLDRFIDHSPGTPRNPLDEEWVLGKFRSSAGLALDAGAVDALAAALHGIDGEAPVADVTRLLRGEAAPTEPTPAATRP